MVALPLILIKAAVGPVTLTKFLTHCIPAITLETGINESCACFKMKCEELTAVSATLQLAQHLAEMDGILVGNGLGYRSGKSANATKKQRFIIKMPSQP